MFSSILFICLLFYGKTRNTFCRTRSLSNATFSFLITWHSSSSKSADMYKISSKSDDFSLIYDDITIFKMAAVRHLGIVRDHPLSFCCWPQLSVKFHVNLIHRSEDISIWIFAYLAWNAYSSPPKWGFWGTFDYSSSIPPKSTSLVPS